MKCGTTLRVVNERTHDQMQVCDFFAGVSSYLNSCEFDNVLRRAIFYEFNFRKLLSLLNGILLVTVRRAVMQTVIRTLDFCIFAD
ncbi:MAG: hypothetical protein JWM11_1613 [Planctomycetaceae bacterium]|nr:hypothetical protein [Planctomycetaceae bacterium]